MLHRKVYSVAVIGLIMTPYSFAKSNKATILANAVRSAVSWEFLEAEGMLKHLFSGQMNLMLADCHQKDDSLKPAAGTPFDPLMTQVSRVTAGSNVSEICKNAGASSLESPDAKNEISWNLGGMPVFVRGITIEEITRIYDTYAPYRERTLDSLASTEEPSDLAPGLNALEKSLSIVNRYFPHYTKSPDFYADFAFNVSVANWMLMNSPIANVRRLGYRNQLALAANDLGIEKPDNKDYPLVLNEYLVQTQKMDFKYTQEYIQKIQKLFSDQVCGGSGDDAKSMAYVHKNLVPALCLGYGDLSCPGAIQEVLTTMNTRFCPGYLFGRLADLPLVRKVLSDADYVKGAAIAANKIIQKIQAAEKNHKVNGDFLSDIISSYQEAGFSRKESTERAWDLVAFYSIRGPSIGGYELR